jgi:preprotein translocase subunit YajC
MGLVGVVTNVGTNSVRIKVSKGELRGIEIDEVSAYVEKFFNVMDSVFVVGGEYQGEEGFVLLN